MTTVDPAGPRTARLRTRRRRRRVLVAVLAVLALLAAVAVAVQRREGDDGAAGAVATPTPTPTGRTQTTVLLGLTTATGATASALLVHDPAEGEGAVVLIPARLLADVPGAGSLPFGRAFALPGQTLAADALADLLGVTVDGTWRLDGSGLRALVDAVGGVVVDVDADLLVRAGDGSATVIVPRGRARLSGNDALRYAGYVAEGEQELASLPRLQAVLDGVLAALPPVERLPGVLAGLGATSLSTLEPEALADVLAGLATGHRAGDLAYESLPVLPLDPGGGPTAYRLDEERAGALVDRLLADSVPEGVRGGGNEVLVLNGVGTPGLGERARGLLVPAGFAYAGSSNVPGFGVGESEVLVRDAGAEARSLGARVARALGLPEDAVKVSSREQSVADVVVVLGADFADSVPGGSPTPTS